MDKTRILHISLPAPDETIRLLMMAGKNALENRRIRIFSSQKDHGQMYSMSCHKGKDFFVLPDFCTFSGCITFNI